MFLCEGAPGIVATISALQIICGIRGSAGGAGVSLGRLFHPTLDADFRDSQQVLDDFSAMRHLCLEPRERLTREFRAFRAERVTPFPRARDETAARAVCGAPLRPTAFAVELLFRLSEARREKTQSLAVLAAGDVDGTGTAIEPARSGKGMSFDFLHMLKIHDIFPNGANAETGQNGHKSHAPQHQHGPREGLPRGHSDARNTAVSDDLERVGAGGEDVTD